MLYVSAFPMLPCAAILNKGPFIFAINFTLTTDWLLRQEFLFGGIGHKGGEAPLLIFIAEPPLGGRSRQSRDGERGGVKLDEVERYHPPSGGRGGI